MPPRTMEVPNVGTINSPDGEHYAVLNGPSRDRRSVDRFMLVSFIHTSTPRPPRDVSFD
jgi:hypothetical protein